MWEKSSRWIWDIDATDALCCWFGFNSLPIFYRIFASPPYESVALTPSVHVWILFQYRIIRQVGALMKYLSFCQRLQVGGSKLFVLVLILFQCSSGLFNLVMMSWDVSSISLGGSSSLLWCACKTSTDKVGHLACLKRRCQYRWTSTARFGVGDHSNLVLYSFPMFFSADSIASVIVLSRAL